MQDKVTCVCVTVLLMYLCVWQMMGRTDGDNYTLDDMFVSSAAQRERSGRDEERQRSKAVQETRRLAGQMEKCRHCFDSPDLPKHLIAAVGNKARDITITVLLTRKTSCWKKFHF